MERSTLKYTRLLQLLLFILMRLRGLGRHMWGEISSSSWGKETFGNKVTPPGQGSLGTRSNASLEKMNKTKRGTNESKGGEAQAQENKSKLIQARKTLEKRDRVLTAAIRRCHFELAKRESLRDIDASKDQVEAAWKEFNHANSRYCVYAGWDPLEKDNTSDKQPEEVRRAGYEWKVRTDMMEQVVDKAEEYLESATKENSWGQLYEDEDGGNELNNYGDDGGELDAKVEVERWAMAVKYREAQVQALEAKEALEQSKEDSNEMPCEDEDRGKELNVKVNEVALEVSTVNENEVNVNEVNDESTVNEASRIACNIKEVAPGVVPYSMIEEVELHMAHNVQVEIVAEVQEEESGTKVWEPGESGVAKPDEVKFDVNVEAKVEVFGMKEVKNLKDDDQVEVFDAKVNNGKVARSGGVKAMMFFYAIYNLLLYTSDVLVALCMARFVNGFRRECPTELSD